MWFVQKKEKLAHPGEWKAVFALESDEALPPDDGLETKERLMIKYDEAKDKVSHAVCMHNTHRP